MLQSGIRRDGLECSTIGSVANYEHVLRIETASGYSKISVTAIGRHDHITETVS